MIEIKLVGTADEVREEMARMLGLRRRETPPAAAAAIQPTQIDRAKTVSGIAEAMNADTAEALETPVGAPQSAQDAPETRDEQTVAEAAETATAKAESAPPAAAAAPSPAEPGREDSAPDGQPEITLVQARERMNGLRQKFGAKAVRQVLDTIGFPKFTDVPAEKYPELMVLCDAMEKGMTNA